MMAEKPTLITSHTSHTCMGRGLGVMGGEHSWARTPQILKARGVYYTKLLQWDLEARGGGVITLTPCVPRYDPTSPNPLSRFFAARSIGPGEIRILSLSPSATSSLAVFARPSNKSHTGCRGGVGT